VLDSDYMLCYSTRHKTAILKVQVLICCSTLNDNHNSNSVAGLHLSSSLANLTLKQHRHQ